MDQPALPVISSHPHLSLSSSTCCVALGSGSASCSASSCEFQVCPPAACSAVQPLLAPTPDTHDFSATPGHRVAADRRSAHLARPI